MRHASLASSDATSRPTSRPQLGMLPLQLVDWFASIEPRLDAELGFGVVVWGRQTGDQRSLAAYAMEQRLSDAMFVLRDGRTVHLVGESDGERAALAGIPKPFVEAFKHGIPPAYEMLVGIAPSILSLAPPQSPLVLPGTSLPPSPLRAPSLSFSATHDHLLPDPLDSDDEQLPPTLFDLGTGFRRKDGAICTRKELYESFVRPKRPTDLENALELEASLGALIPDRDEDYKEDAAIDEVGQANSQYRPPTPPGSTALPDATHPLPATTGADDISPVSPSLVPPTLDVTRPPNVVTNSTPASPRPTLALPVAESAPLPSVAEALPSVNAPVSRADDVETELEGSARPVEELEMPLVTDSVPREPTPPPTLPSPLPQTPASQTPASYLSPTRATPTHSHSRPTTPASLRRLRAGMPSPSPDQPRSSLGSISDLYQESEADSADGYMRDVVDFVQRDTAGLGSECEIREAFREMDGEEMGWEREREESLAPTERDPTPELEPERVEQLDRLQSIDALVEAPTTEVDHDYDPDRPSESDVSPPADLALDEPQLVDDDASVDEAGDAIKLPAELPLAFVAADNAVPSPLDTTSLPHPLPSEPVQADTSDLVLAEAPQLGSLPPIEPLDEAAKLTPAESVAVEELAPGPVEEPVAPSPTPSIREELALELEVETPHLEDDEMLEPPPEPDLADEAPAAELGQDSPAAAVVEASEDVGAENLESDAYMGGFEDSPNVFGGGSCDEGEGEGELVAPRDTAGMLSPARSSVAAEALLQLTGAHSRPPSPILTTPPSRRSPTLKTSRPFVQVIVKRRPAARSSSQDDLALQPAPSPAKTGPFSTAPPSQQRFSGPSARKLLVSVEVPVRRAQLVASTSKLDDDPFAASAPAAARPARQHRSPTESASTRVPPVAAIPPSVFFASVSGDDGTRTRRRRKGKARALPSPSPSPEPEPEPAPNEQSDDERTSLAPPSPPPATRRRPASSKPLASGKLARKGAPTTASTPLVATAAFAHRSRSTVAASSTVPTARAREDSAAPGTGSGGRPARARKSAAGWWELPKALDSLKTFKRPLSIEPNEEPETEEEETVVVRPAKRARKKQDVNIAPKRQTTSEPHKAKAKVHQSQPTSLSNDKVPSRFRGRTQWEGMTEVVAREDPFGFSD